MTFRFDLFADAHSAQAAFDAAFPAGSPADAALQALVDLGAQCKSAGAGKVACRYVEKPGALVGWYWHVVIEAGAEKTIQRVAIAQTSVGV